MEVGWLPFSPTVQELVADQNIGGWPLEKILLLDCA